MINNDQYNVAIKLETWISSRTESEMIMDNRTKLRDLRHEAGLWP